MVPPRSMMHENDCPSNDDMDSVSSKDAGSYTAAIATMGVPSMVMFSSGMDSAMRSSLSIICAFEMTALPSLTASMKYASLSSFTGSPVLAYALPSASMSMMSWNSQPSRCASTTAAKREKVVTCAVCRPDDTVCRNE